MTFEQWRVRPVHIAQVFSSQIYKETGLPRWWFRVVRKYRQPAFQIARNKVAAQIREKRKNGLNFRQVKEIAVRRINNPTGTAERVNFDEILENIV